MSHVPALSRPLSFNDLHSLSCAEELFALARAVEQEGVRRYDALAAGMDAQNKPPLAALFRYLCEQEKSHENTLSTLAYRGGLGALPPLSFAWDVLAEGIMPRSVADLSPAQALQYALLNEQRTYALFLRIAGNTHIAEIRHHAEQLAAEELEHVHQLAQYQLRMSEAASRAEAPASAHSLDDILAVAASESHVAAGRRSALAAQLRKTGDTLSAALLQDLAEDAEARSRELGGSGGIDQSAFAESANDNFSPLDLVKGEAHRTFTTFHSFARLAHDLPASGLSSLAAHEATLRLAASSRLEDRAAAIRGHKRRLKPFASFKALTTSSSRGRPSLANRLGSSSL